MKSNLENVSTLERKLNIEVPAAEVQAAFDRAFTGVQRNVTVKGFRKGKAPISTIKTMYGDRVKQDVIQDIIQTHYATALKEHKLEPISYPTIEFDPLPDTPTDTENFSFSAEFEIKPEVTLKKTEGLTVKKEKFVMNDALTDATIEDIRKGRAETGPVLEDRPAQMGDVAVVDFKGFVDGKELENGAAEGHELELGSNSFIPGFEEGLVGMRVGVSSAVNLKFPDEYHVKELAGKPVEFKVTLKELKKKSLPEVNDEFAKALGPYENLAGLRTAIAADFEQREGKRVNEDLRNRFMKVLVDNNPVTVPKTMLEDQKKALVEDMEKRMQQQGMGTDQFETYKKQWDADFTQTASYMIQSSFLIDKIAAENKLKADPADIDKKLVEYAAQTGIEVARIADFYKEGDRRARLAYQVTEEKVIDYLLTKAKIEEVSKEQLEKEDAKKA
jgi:trigger factor